MELTYTTTQVDGQSEYDLFGMANNEIAGFVFAEGRVSNYLKNEVFYIGWKSGKESLDDVYRCFEKQR